MKILIILFLTANICYADKYLESGLPSSTREWFSVDYSTTSKILSLKPRLLPSSNEAIFKRMVNLENLNYFKNKNNLLKNRMSQYINILKSLPVLLCLYIQKYNSGHKVNNEIMDMMIFTLHVQSLGLTLMNEFIPTIKKDDKYETRMKGVKTFSSSLTTAFVGAEVSLGERHLYTPQNLSKLLSTMKETLPLFLQVFSIKYQNSPFRA